MRGGQCFYFYAIFLIFDSQRGNGFDFAILLTDCAIATRSVNSKMHANYVVSSNKLLIAQLIALFDRAFEQRKFHDVKSRRRRQKSFFSSLADSAWHTIKLEISPLQTPIKKFRPRPSNPSRQCRGHSRGRVSKKGSPLRPLWIG